MTVALVALGASLGRRRETLALAVAGLDRLAGCAVVGVSRAYRTSPEGAARCWFLNAVVRVRTQLGPFDLLRGIQELERRLGRRRTRRWADRCVDIDLLLFGEEVVDDAHLTIPHPRMMDRPFVWIPAIEVAPELMHPVLEIPLAAAPPPSGPRPIPHALLGPRRSVLRRPSS